METGKIPQAPRESANLLLAQLPEDEYRELKSHLEHCHTPIRTVIYERGKEIRHAYFPLSGAHSVLAVMEDGAAVEVGTVGKEGFSTVDILTGSTTAIETTICQIPGDSLRIPVEKFNEMRRKLSALDRLCHRFLHAYLSQVSQSVACNRLHSTQERFARWILMSRDRVGNDTFQLTQEFLADMLGVHRPSVSLIAREFQQAGLIRYNRGVITVMDKAGLEEACCECYGVVKKQIENVIGKGKL